MVNQQSVLAIDAERRSGGGGVALVTTGQVSAL